MQQNSQTEKSLSSTLPPPRESSSLFSVERFLYDLSLRDLTETDLFLLDRLCKKIEVVRKVYVFYLPDLSRSVERSPIQEPYGQELSAALLRAAEETGDLKFFNSVLKIRDGILLLPQLELQSDLCQLITEYLNRLETR